MKWSQAGRVIRAAVLIVPVLLSSAALANPVVVMGNPTCASLGLGGYCRTIQPPFNPAYPLDDYLGLTHTLLVVPSPDGLYFDWASDLGITAVIVNGGLIANVYWYDPASQGDIHLSAPVDLGTGVPYTIYDVQFGFNEDSGPAQIPEPPTIVLLGIGLLGTMGRKLQG